MEYRQITVNGARVHFTEAGQGHPLLLVHGMSGSARWWQRNIPALGERFRVLAVDLPGFGRSRGQPFRLAQAPGLLAGLLDALGLPAAHVIGHSMGGLTAAALAACQPRRVTRLVLVDAAAAPLGASLPAALARLVRSANCVGPSFYPTLVSDAAAAGPGTLLAAGRALLSADLTSELPRVTQPTLIVWGRRDSLLPPAYGQRIASLLPHAEWKMMTQAGHNPMWDQPQEFNRLVTEFLTRQ